MAITKMTGNLPRIYTCKDNVTNVDYLDIDYSALSLVGIPSVVSNTSVDVNVHVSDVTSSTARLHFSQKFTGTVYYSVIGFN
mgnify:CR=1 FL=1